MDDFLNKFNLIDGFHGVIGFILSLRPKRKTHKGRKVGPWLVQPGMTEIAVDRSVSTGADAEGILAEVGIPVYGRRITNREAIFLVRSRQANWAEYNLAHRGVIFGPSHRVINARNFAGNMQPVRTWSSRRG